MFKNTIQTKIIVKIALLFTCTLLFTNCLQAQQVAKGSNFSVVVRNDGTLWAWGDNTYGQLGDGTNTFRYTPVQIGTASNWKAVWAGDFHTAAIKTDGTLWVWGRNNYGQLGVGTNDDYNTPIQINLAKNWSTVTCGFGSTFAIKTDGTLWVFGRNNFGQLGDGTTIDKNTPVLISSTIGWKKIASNSSNADTWFFTTAIKSDGSLWFWGYNTGNFSVLANYGNSNFIKLNTSTLIPTLYNSSNWISVGSFYGIQNNGTLWYFSDSPIQIGSSSIWKNIEANGKVLSKSDGTFWYNNFISNAQTKSQTQITNAIDCKYLGVNLLYQDTTVAIYMKSDGNIYSWGNNINFDLGIGKSFESIVSKPTQVGKDKDWKLITKYDSNPLVQKTNGILWAWGSSYLGRSGCGVNNDLFEPSVVNLSKDWLLEKEQNDFVYNYAKSRYVLKTDGSLWSWGSGSSVPTQFGTSKDWSRIYYDDATSVYGIKTDGSLWAWGSNFYGQLGDGTNIDKSMPIQIGNSKDWLFLKISGFSVFGLKSDNSLWAWGDNRFGQLGDGTTVSKNIPNQIGNEKNWLSIKSLNLFTVALKTDSSIWAWGRNLYGQLGDGTKENKSIPTQIGASKDWLNLYIGRANVYAKKIDGSLWAWGNNSYGQLGDGTNIDKSIPIQIGTSKDWSNIYIGWASAYAIKTDGSLWVWGNNSYGQLGDGTNIDKNMPIQIEISKDWSNIILGNSVNVNGYIGGNSALALKTDGSLWSWGSNNFGQLGIGGQRDFDVPQLVNFSNNALPVSALNLDGIASANKIQLSFTAINETDMDHYEIEKSAEGRVFTTIGELIPQNKNQNQTQYQFTDANPSEGQNFYRIKGISLNGKQQYSNVIALKKNTKPNSIVSPNPLVGNLLRLKTNNLTKGKYQATIIDALGRVILKKQIIVDNTTTEILIHLDAKPRVGNYYLQIAGENTKITSAFEINQ